MNPNPQNTQGEQLDPSIVNLTKAIGRTESGGNYEAKGKSGEFGAYQFRPETWKAWAKQHLGNENAPMSKENQDKVAYKQVETWGKQGYKPAQIASLWNSGKPEWEGNVGVNSMGVKFDTPSYVKSVGGAYEELQKGNVDPVITPNPSTVTQPVQQPEPTLGQEIKNRVGDLTKAVADTTTGKINPISGVIQTAGAVAGGIGDVVNKGLELIPGVKKVEELLGKGVGKLANTSAGQSVINSIAEWSKKHPELSADIGAGFNIATAIPILRGLGAVKNIALDSVSTALKGIAEKGAVKDLTEVASRTVGGRKMLKASPDSIKTLVKERALPEIENGRYATKDAFDNLENSISSIEDNQLQTELGKAQEVISRSHESEGLRAPSITTLKDEAIKNAEKELSGTGNLASAKARIAKIFDENQGIYGDSPTLQQINEMKRTVRRGVNFTSPQVDHDVNYIVGQTIQKSIENTAKKLGLKDIEAINKSMADLIKAQQILKHIDSRPVKSGLLGGLIKEGIKDVATVGGEIAGNATGIPLAGTLVGRGTGGLLSKSVGNLSPKGAIREAILKRTGKDATKQSLKSGIKKVSGLIGGGTINRIQNTQSSR